MSYPADGASKSKIEGLLSSVQNYFLGLEHQRKLRKKMNEELSSYQLWQEKKYGNHLPEPEIDESSWDDREDEIVNN
jgi:hypothetical protein